MISNQCTSSFSFRKHCAIAWTKERLVADKKFVLVQSVALYFQLKENYYCQIVQSNQINKWKHILNQISKKQHKFS